MIVMKFGGTSVEDAGAIDRVTEIVRKEENRKPIVVVSACAGVTNQLLKVADLSARGQKNEASGIINEIKNRHEHIVDELIHTELPKNYLKGKISVYAHELKNLSNAVSVLGEVTNRSRDAFVSYGERMSSMIVAQAFEEKSIKATLVDAREFMITDDSFTKAKPNYEKIASAAKDLLLPRLNECIVVTQGFIGATEDGVVTTIGRGGSDFSASIIGAVLNVDEIQIWTDVDGILTADPSIVPQARRIRRMSFNEASELAYFGARVLHPMTILPAVEKNIPVYVRNSRNPEYQGTLITRHDANGNGTPKSIAYKERITLINLVSSRMFLAHDFLQAVFAVFNKHKTIAHAVASSEVSVSIAIDETEHLNEIVEELRQFSDVEISSNKAIVCIVGENIKHNVGFIGQVFSALSGIHINMISHGASEINLSFVVDEDSLNSAVRLLHQQLFGNVSQQSDIFD